MNRFNLIAACVLGLAALTLSAQESQTDLPKVPSALAASEKAPAPTFTEPQMLEQLGWFVGKQLGLSELGFSKDQTDYIVKGLMVASAGKESPYDMEKIGPQLDAFMRTKKAAYMARLRDQNLAEGKALFEKLNADKDVVELPSGLRYKILAPGTGAYPKATDTLKVDYTGKLVDGTVFDSTEEHGQPAEFELDKVIPGWTEGLQKINKGGKIRLYIPPKLAYGDNGQGPIPPGATLIFDVHVLDINPPAAAASEAKK